MSEQLKPSSETLSPDPETSYGLNTLTEMADKFDPEAAARRVEAVKQANTNLSPEDPASNTSPETITSGAGPEATSFEPVPEEPNPSDSSEQSAINAPNLIDLAAFEQERKEPTPEEAADEYLSLLDELSQGFTNPYYSNERQGQHHYAPNITTDLGKKYSKNPHYRWQGYAGTEAGDTDGTMLRIASADNILKNEILWREDGAKNAEKLEQTKSELATLDEDYSKKSAFAKFFGKRKYNKQRAQLENTISSISYQTAKHNKNIAQELAISYNNQGDYAGNPQSAEAENESRNRQFFGLDDPERAAKVERAIALRQKYEAIWKSQQPSSPEKPAPFQQSATPQELAPEPTPAENQPESPAPKTDDQPQTPEYPLAA